MTTDHSRNAKKADSKKNSVDNHFKYPLYFYICDLFELLFLCCFYVRSITHDTAQICHRDGRKNMIRPIVRDIIFLGQKSEEATKQDLSVGQDLQDTLKANQDRCVGMAANMIAMKKRIIIVNMGFVNVVMYNPVIVKKGSPYETEEGCLSLDGVRKTTRYQNIEVEYLDSSWKKQRQKYSGWTAQIIQHEVDHLNGIII